MGWDNPTDRAVTMILRFVTSRESSGKEFFVCGVNRDESSARATWSVLAEV